MTRFSGATYRLTKPFVENLPYAQRDHKGKVEQRLYWDAHDHGLGVLVGLNTKTFVCQRSVNSRSVRATLGRFGNKGISVDQARKLYRDRFAALQRGEERAPKLTLREAWQQLYKPMLEKKKRAPATVMRYWDTLQTYFGDWLDRPLAGISDQDASDRHAQIAEGVKKRRPRFNGEASANQAIKIIKLIYRRSQRTYRRLPACPFDTVAAFERSAEVGPARRPIPDHLVLKWLNAVRAMENKVIADALQFALYSGMSKASILQMQWVQVDLKRKRMHLPRPNGGAKAAFDLPLSAQLIAILHRREKERSLYAGAAKCSPWVFPSAASRTGHLAHLAAQVGGIDHCVHELRNTFSSIARCKAGIDEQTIGTILNHREPKRNMTQGHARTNPEDLVEHLRRAMQRVADAIDRFADDDGSGIAVPMRKRRA
jgi:integrase